MGLTKIIQYLRDGGDQSPEVMGTVVSVMLTRRSVWSVWIALVPYHLVTYITTIIIAVTSCYSSPSSLVTVSLGSAVAVLLSW